MTDDSAQGRQRQPAGDHRQLVGIDDPYRCGRGAMQVGHDEGQRDIRERRVEDR